MEELSAPRLSLPRSKWAPLVAHRVLSCPILSMDSVKDFGLDEVGVNVLGSNNSRDCIFQICHAIRAMSPSLCGDLRYQNQLPKVILELVCRKRTFSQSFQLLGFRQI